MNDLLTHRNNLEVRPKAQMRRMLSPLVETARAFTAAKTVDSRALNAAGVQVARAVVAHGLHRARRHRPEGYHAEIQSIRDVGWAAVPNLLDGDHLQQTRREALEVLSREATALKRHDHGGAIVEQVNLKLVPEGRYPALKALMEHDAIRSLMAGAERRPVDLRDTLCAVERVTQQPEDLHDAESDLHIDTFFNTHKAWLYLDDVELDDGPFVFVPESHRLDGDRLRRIYQESVTTNRGSRRIDELELALHGSSEKVFTCAANTLVAANTCGYHRRMRGKPGRSRLAVHFSVRKNPFFPKSLAPERWLSRQNPVVRWAVGARS